jgi:hypothetical protein
MKELLIENISLKTINTKRSELTEEVNTVSDSMIFYSVPVWRLDEVNLNGRTYTTTLAERLIAENAITYSYCDHPDEEYAQDFNSVKAVSKNPQIVEGNLCVDVHLVDREFGEKLKAIVKAGSEVGVSSVGYGSMNEANVIEADSFELVRYLDFVLNPSYSVFITDENNEVKENEEIVDNTDSDLEEKLDEKTLDSSEETTVSISEDELEVINKRFNKWKN